MDPRTLFISSRSSACIQIGLWSSEDEIVHKEVRERIWTPMWEAGLKGVWLSLQPVCGPDLAPLPDLTTHHPQTRTPAHGPGSGSLCTESQPQSTCPALGNRKPRDSNRNPGARDGRRQDAARLRQLHFLASVPETLLIQPVLAAGLKLFLPNSQCDWKPLAAE